MDTTCGYREALLQDVTMHLKDKMKALDDEASCKQPLKETTAAIATWILEVEDEVALDAEWKQILEEFQSVFAEVPHVDKPPTDVLAEI
jgi:hypothetical protein